MSNLEVMQPLTRVYISGLLTEKIKEALLNFTNASLTYNFYIITV